MKLPLRISIHFQRIEDLFD
jgi:hypothetical protein